MRVTDHTGTPVLTFSPPAITVTGHAWTPSGAAGCITGRKPHHQPACHTTRISRMTMLSFRVDDRDADAAQRWAQALGIDRSQLLRDALRRHLDRLASETDTDRWNALPLAEGELALSAIADWGPAEDWSDWE